MDQETVFSEKVPEEGLFSIAAKEHNIINPYELVGYAAAAPRYEKAVQLLKTGQWFSENDVYLDELSRDFVQILKMNGERLAGDNLGSDIMNRLMYAQVRPFHDQDTDGVYLGADIFFRSMLPDDLLDKEISKINDWRVHSVDDLNYENLVKLSKGSRNYLVQRIPLTPWLHIEMAEPKRWNIRSGIDNCEMIIEDNCGSGPQKGYLSSYTEELLNNDAELSDSVAKNSFYPFIDNLPKDFFREDRIEISKPSDLDKILHGISDSYAAWR